MRIEPFNLYDTKALLYRQGVKLNNQQIIQLYMAIGGIPHYLTHVEPGLSAAQNIDLLCFTKDGILFNEFDNLFASLFNKSESHEEIIRLISQTHYGMSRAELAEKSKLSSGGWLNKRLKELEEAGFIASFTPYQHSSRGTYYKVIDEYSLFYLHWIEPYINSIRRRDIESGYWDAKKLLPTWKSWAGYAFESICYKHISAIRRALKINFGAEIATWRYSPRSKQDDRGAQIDLLFDRNDDVVTICEIKYTVDPFIIDKQCAQILLNKTSIFKQQTRTSKQIFIAMISANGIKQTMYSEELINAVVTLDDLFVGESS